MKWMFWYGLALAALVAVVLRRDHINPVPTGKYDGRVTVFECKNRAQAEDLVRLFVDWSGYDGCKAVGQVAPEGMLK